MKAAVLLAAGLVASVLSAALLPRRASADMVTYTVDPARSTLTLSGTYGGQQLQPQEVNTIPPPTEPYDSLVTSFAGTITANRDAALSTFRIISAGVSAQDNGPYAPPPSNQQVADFGFGVSPLGASLPNSSISFEGALRSLSFSLSTPTIASAGAFNTSLLSGTFVAGELDYAFITYSIPITFPPTETDGMSPATVSLLFGSGDATILDVGDQETLTLPLNAQFIIDVNGDPLDMNLSGNIVATATIPEPASAAMLAAFGIICLFRNCRAR